MTLDQVLYQPAWILCC